MHLEIGGVSCSHYHGSARAGAVIYFDATDEEI